MKMVPTDYLPERRYRHDLQDFIEQFVDGRMKSLGLTSRTRITKQLRYVTNVCIMPENVQGAQCRFIFEEKRCISLSVDNQEEPSLTGAPLSFFVLFTDFVFS